jgi:thiamine biosynthesis lipoprotein
MRGFLLILVLIVASRGHSQVFSRPADAFALSKQMDKPVLLIFSGSDWCVPCIQFNKKILKDSVFLKFASNKLVLLEADFPQRKKIPTDLKKAYESLAERFNPNGIFPLIVILTAEDDGGIILPVKTYSTTDLISEIKRIMGWP